MLRSIFDGSKRSNSSKGVTPVIAVLLLLMMTVAAAGGAYVWMTSLQEDLKEQTQSEAESMNRDISLNELTCDNDGTIEVLLRNSGEKEIDLNPVDMEIRNADTGEINFSLSKLDMDLTGTDASDADFVSLEGDGVASPGGTGYYTLSAEGEFQSNMLYEITFIFKDEDSYEKTAECRTE